MIKVIEQSVVFEYPEQLDQGKVLGKLEICARNCYKSEDKIKPGSAEAIIKAVIAKGHHSVLEHCSITVRVICDRGVSHEIVRHRIASFSQESTRYCNYSQGKYDRQITVIRPLFWTVDSPQYGSWYVQMVAAETAYFKLLEQGATPQEARSVLPNSLKTEIIITANMREWREIIRQRTAKDAHPQMRQVAQMILKEFREKLPVLFSDVGTLQ